jgi:hypothetical protein
MTRYEFAAFLERIVRHYIRTLNRHDPEEDTQPPPPEHSAAFWDLPAPHWASRAVRSLHEEWGTQAGILGGYPDGAFVGSHAISRAEFAVAMDQFADWTRVWWLRKDERKKEKKQAKTIDRGSTQVRAFDPTLSEANNQRSEYRRSVALARRQT